MIKNSNLAKVEFPVEKGLNFRMEDKWWSEAHIMELFSRKTSYSRVKCWDQRC